MFAIYGQQLYKTTCLMYLKNNDVKKLFLQVGPAKV